MRRIKVLLADDHAIVRQGLVYFLRMQEDVEIVGEAANGSEAVEAVRRYGPDVVLMDLIMPEMNGIEATRLIRQENEDVKVIVLTSFSDKDHVLAAVKAGANGYLPKDVDPSQIVEAIRGAYAGLPQLHPSAAGQLMSHIADADRENPGGGAGRGGSAASAAAGTEALTPRELDILRGIARGMSNKELAAAYGIAEKTVKTHVSSVLGKLGLADRTQAALYAVKHGIAEQD